MMLLQEGRMCESTDIAGAIGQRIADVWGTEAVSSPSADEHRKPPG
jgi:hypothetical protein